MTRRKARRWIVAAGILAGWAVGGFADRPDGRSRAQEAPRGGKYALLIGIDRYDEVTLDELTGYVRRNVDQLVQTRRATSPMPLLLGDVGFVVLHDRSAIPPSPEFITSKATGMKLKLIPAGEFLMGSSRADDPNAEANEMPRHRVKISQPYYLGVTEVTRGQYRAITGKSPGAFKSSDDLPVECVTWLDAVKYCNALSEKEDLRPFYRIAGEEVTVLDWGGEGYRLPTEAEWEYACRAGTTTRFSFGASDSDLENNAWINGKNSAGRTHVVGGKRANGWGLHDMHGNVCEWCWDWYDKDYYAQSPAVDPRGPSEGDFRVNRGGGWFNRPRYARSAYRGRLTPDSDAPDNAGGDLGFRLARGRFGG